MSKILIVDDELRVRDLIKKYAKFEGYEVCEASNGLKALEICKTSEPDIIIMDVMMPELDGFSACREIRKFSNVPIIMLSARGEEYDKVHGFESGVDDYVVKPFSPKEPSSVVITTFDTTSSNSFSKVTKSLFLKPIYIVVSAFPSFVRWYIGI